MSCTHKPISYQISLSNDLYRFIFNDQKFSQTIKTVPFRYYSQGKSELIYTGENYINKKKINEGETLTLFDDNDLENEKAFDFFEGVIKMCGDCFFEYLKKYNLEIHEN